MANWISYSKVRKFAKVRAAYPRYLQFITAVQTEIRATHTWAREAPGSTARSGTDAMQINVEAIPNVTPLRSNGSALNGAYTG
jgi:hypothetical protein